jgi:hypothetical protein
MHADKPSEKKRWEDVVWTRHLYNDRTVLKSGSFLFCYCPHCGESLMHDNMVHLRTVTSDGRTGWVELSPYLNVFERRSDLHLPEHEEVDDLHCSSCRQSLKVDDRQCDSGDSHVARVLVGISNVRVPFYFCMRVGCHWHCIDPDDEHRIILDESMEW